MPQAPSEEAALQRRWGQDALGVDHKREEGVTEVIHNTAAWNSPHKGTGSQHGLAQPDASPPATRQEGHCCISISNSCVLCIDLFWGESWFEFDIGAKECNFAWRPWTPPGGRTMRGARS